jgi:ribosome-binding factor A
MVTPRMQKFDELIKRELSREIQALFPDSFISITQVHVSKDLSFAKVWLSSTKDIDQLVKEVRFEAANIRKNLSQKIVARRVPSLYFVSDKTEEHAQKIENLLSKIKSDENDINS